MATLSKASTNGNIVKSVYLRQHCQKRLLMATLSKVSTKELFISDRRVSPPPPPFIVRRKHSTLPTSLRSVCSIEEGFIKKPRQTVVLAFWGKMATNMLLLRLCSRRIDIRRAGSKLWGYTVFVYYIFYNILIGFPSNVLHHSSK